MSRAGLQHALARVLEGKEIRLKNNKLPLQPRCIERFTIPRVKTHWPVIFAISLIFRLLSIASNGKRIERSRNLSVMA